MNRDAWPAQCSEAELRAGRASGCRGGGGGGLRAGDSAASGSCGCRLGSVAFVVSHKHLGVLIESRTPLCVTGFLPPGIHVSIGYTYRRQGIPPFLRIDEHGCEHTNTHISELSAQRRCGASFRERSRHKMGGGGKPILRKRVRCYLGQPMLTARMKPTINRKGIHAVRPCD